MPTYDYRCDANGRVVEVNHRMREEITHWGDLCARAGIDPGDTPLDAPVKRLATGGHVITGGGRSAAAPLPSCSTGSCCPGGFCGLN